MDPRDQGVLSMRRIGGVGRGGNGRKKKQWRAVKGRLDVDGGGEGDHAIPMHVVWLLFYSGGRCLFLGRLLC